MIYACTTFGSFFFPVVCFHSRVTGACPGTMELIMRVNVRTIATTATTTATGRYSSPTWYRFCFSFVPTGICPYPVPDDENYAEITATRWIPFLF